MMDIFDIIDLVSQTGILTESIEQKLNYILFSQEFTQCELEALKKLESLLVQGLINIESHQNINQINT
jgi:hypothetical protein